MIAAASSDCPIGCLGRFYMPKRECYTLWRRSGYLAPLGTRLNESAERETVGHDAIGQHSVPQAQGFLPPFQRGTGGTYGKKSAPLLRSTAILRAKRFGTLNNRLNTYLVQP